MNNEACVPKIGEVQSETDLLSNAVYNVNDLIQNLSNVLSPILSEKNETEKKISDAPVHQLAPLAGSLRSIRHKVEEGKDMLQEILSYIEL